LKSILSILQEIEEKSQKTERSRLHFCFFEKTY